MANPARGPRNFEAYWKMEAANVFLVPGFALALGFPRGALEGLAIGLAMVATAGFLLVGTAFWRGVDRRLRFGECAPALHALDLADRVERPLLAVSLTAVVATAAAGANNGWSPAVIAAAALSLLAGLEYVNYYRRQLQHFDNKTDMKRLLSGRGFKRSHMARDLAAHRLARSAGERIAH